MLKIGLDCGFGDTKVAISRGNTPPQFFKETNTIVKMTSDDDSVIKYDPNHPNLIKSPDGSRIYYIGANALQFPDDRVITVMDYDALKNIAPLLLLKYMREYSEQIDRVVTAISIAYAKYANEFKAFISEQTKFPVEKLQVVPQGIGGKVAIDYVG